MKRGPSFGPRKLSGMVTTAVKLIVGGCSAFFLAVLALSIALPLVLIKNDNHLIVAVIPGLNDGTIKALRTLDDPVYNRFFDENVITSLNDDAKNLKHFTATDNMGSNYLKMALDEENYVMLGTEGDYNSRVPVDLLGRHETTDFPNIIPSVFISGGLEKMDEAEKSLYDEAYEDQYLDLKSIFNQEGYALGAIMNSDAFGYKIDYPGKYDAMIAYFAREKLSIFETKGISILDFAKSEDALTLKDGISYLVETQFMLDLFLKSNAFDKKNVLLLPSLPQSEHIYVDDEFNMDMIKNVRHSFDYLLEEDIIPSCSELENIFGVEKLKGCVEDNMLTIDYLYELVEKNFGIRTIDNSGELKVFGQGKKLSKLESDTHTFKSLGQEISRTFKYQSGKEEEEIPNDDRKIIVNFDVNTHQFLNNPCHLSTSLESVNVGITSEAENFELVDIYCQRGDIKEIIAFFAISFYQRINVNLSTCDNIFLRIRGDDKDQDNIIIPKTKNIKFTDNIQLGSIINFEMDDPCKDAFSVSRCVSDSFDHSCETIDFPYIYTDFSNDYIHFEVIDHNNPLSYEQITLPVMTVQTIISETNTHASGFENYVVLEGLTISPSDKTNDWEIPVKLQYEDDGQIDILLRYDSNEENYVLVIDEDDYFREGNYKFEIDEHDYEFEIPTHLDFGESMQSFFTNNCHVEDTLIGVDIAVDRFVKDDVLLICDDDGQLIETWKEGEYALVKDINISDCENIYLKVQIQDLDYQTTIFNIKTTAIEVPNDVYLHTKIPFDVGVEECKDSFFFYRCDIDECVEIRSFPHINTFLNINNEEYYSILGSSNEYEYSTLVPIETEVEMEPTTYIGSLTTNIQLATLSIVPTDPDNIEGYDVKVDHIIDDIVIETLDGKLIPSDTNAFHTEDVSKGYDLVLENRSFENGRYMVSIGNANVIFDVELLASLDKDIHSAIRNTCFTPSSTFEYMVHFHEEIDTDVYVVCQKDGLDNNVEKVRIPFERTVSVTDCDLIFLTSDPDVENSIKYDEIIPRFSDITIAPITEERLLGSTITLDIEDLSCLSKDFILEKCVIDGECTIVDFMLDEDNILSITHPLKHFEYSLKSGDIEHIKFNFVPVTTITLDNHKVSLIDNGNGILLDNFIIEPASLENSWEVKIKIEFGDTILDATLKHSIVDGSSIFKVNLKDDKFFEFGEYVLLFEHGDDYKITRISVIVSLEFDGSTNFFLSNECHLTDTLGNVPMNIYNNIDNGYLVCLNNVDIIYRRAISKNTPTTFDLSLCNKIYLTVTDVNGDIHKSEAIRLERTSFIDIHFYDGDIILFGSTINYDEGISQLCIDNLVLEQYRISDTGELIPSNYEIGTGYLESNGDDFMFVIKGRKNDFEYKKYDYKSENVEYIHVDSIYNNAGDEFISPFNLIIDTPLQELYWTTPLHILMNNEKHDVLLTHDENGYVLETVGDYGFEAGTNLLIFPGDRKIPFMVDNHSNTYNLVTCILDKGQKTCQRNFDHILEPSIYYIELENNISLPSDYEIKIYIIVGEDDSEFLQYVEQSDRLNLLPGSYHICVYDDLEAVVGNSCITIDIVASPAQFSEITLNAIPQSCMVDIDEFNIPIHIDDVFKRSVSIVCIDDLDNILREEVYDDYDDTDNLFNIGHCVKLLVLLECEKDLEKYQDLIQIKQFYLDYNDDESTMYFGHNFDVKLVNTCEPDTPSKVFINEKETNHFQLRHFLEISINIEGVVGESLSISKSHRSIRIDDFYFDSYNLYHALSGRYTWIWGGKFELIRGSSRLFPAEQVILNARCTNRHGDFLYYADLKIEPSGRIEINGRNENIGSTFLLTVINYQSAIALDIDAFRL